ncbi:MAG: CYTH and CHAD domain-containing protein, partial [Sporichthyaceae bacterium]|nr:CYTH and CHAD domain-containing protein [Sporichthyaceae bacterium]
MRTTETERKYDLPVAFNLPTHADFGGYRLDGPVVHRLSATYYDTPSLTLARHGVTLRRRTGGTDAGWHLKRPAGPWSRTEIHAPLRPGRIVVPAAFDPELAALRRGQELEPVAKLTTRRTEWAVVGADGDPLALIADDRVTVHRPDRVGVAARWRELEVELADGAETVLAELDAVLVAHGARPASAAAKLTRAIADRLPAQPKESRSWRLVADYARQYRNAMVELDPAVRRDEPDAVHQMRVAARRLRSLLRTFRPLLDTDRSEPLRAELRWVAAELGQARDTEVVAERLTAGLDEQPPELVVGPVRERLARRFDTQLAGARDTALACLDSDRFFAVLDELDELIDSAPVRKPVMSDVRAEVRRAIRRTDRELTEASTANGVQTGADVDVLRHEARKSAKRARYAVEVLAPVSGKPARRLVDDLKRIQDVLGT